MIQRGEIQRNESIDFLDNLDFDFFKMDNFNNSSDRNDNDGTLQFQPFADSMPMNQEFSFDQQFDDDKKHTVDVDKRRNNSEHGHSNSHSHSHTNSNPTSQINNTTTSTRPRNASIDSMISFLGSNNYRNRHDSMGSFSYDLDSLAHTHQPDPYSHIETSSYPPPAMNSNATTAGAGMSYNYNNNFTYLMVSIFMI